MFRADLEPLSYGRVTLRQMVAADEAQWSAVRQENWQWLQQWDSTNPRPEMAVPSFKQMARDMRKRIRAQHGAAWVIEVDGHFAGQLNIGPVMLGSALQTPLGYWVAQAVAGQGVAPTAVALAADFCFTQWNLHRIELNIRPENHPSIRVAQKLGFRYEGLRERFLHINGDWCDHQAWALTQEEVPGGLLKRWEQSPASQAVRLISPPAIPNTP